MVKLPFEGTTPFAQKTSVGKLVYIAGVISAILGAVLVTWETTAFASERLEQKIVEVATEATQDAVKPEDIMPIFQQMQNAQNMYFIQNQIGIKQLEMRSVDSEINRIVEDQQQLTPEQVVHLDDLREDRTIIKQQLDRLQTDLNQQQQQMRRIP